MSTIILKNIQLRMANLAAKPSEKTVEVDSVSTQYKFNKETKERTDEIVGYTLDFYGVKGGIQTVKLPTDCKATIETIQRHLENCSIVRVNFGNPSTLLAHPYAMLDKQTRELRSGVTASAKEVVVVSVDEPEVFDDEFIE